jgi:signal transduction histidine kinase
LTRTELRTMRAQAARWAFHKPVSAAIKTNRINRGKRDIQPSWQKLEVILDTGLTACEKSLLSRRQSLSVDRERAPSDVFADPTRIVQCITNLISNASKFAPEGSVINIVVSSGAGFVTFAVADEGPGVAAEDASTIFEMFAQGQGPASSGGLGIGLSLVKQIAKGHGGDVRLVTSVPAKGACLVLELPLPERSETDGSTVKVETPRPRSGVRGRSVFNVTLDLNTFLPAYGGGSARCGPEALSH